MTVCTQTDRAIDTSHLLLRPLQCEDAQNLWHCVWHSQSVLQPWCAWANNYTLADAQAFIDACQLSYQQSQPSSLYYVVWLRNSMQVVGVIGLSKCCWLTRSAHMGIWLDCDAQGYGHAIEAARALCLHSHHHWQWRMFYWATHPDNHASVRLAERLGFSKLSPQSQAADDVRMDLYQKTMVVHAK